MNARKVKRRAKAQRSNGLESKRQPHLIEIVMQKAAGEAIELAFSIAWRAALNEDLDDIITLDDFVREFIGAMRAEIERKAAYLTKGGVS